MLADDRRSWQLQPDATWLRTEVIEGRPGTIDTFEVLKERPCRSAPWRRPRGARAPAPARWIRARDRRGRAGPVEVELKYRVDDLAAAERLPGGRAGRALRGDRRPRPLDASSRTATWIPPTAPSRRAGFAVRLRQSRRRDHRLGQVARRARTAPAARPSRGTRGPGRSGRPRPSTGPPRTPDRWCSSMPATRRSSSVVTVRQLRRKRLLKSSRDAASS